MGQDGVHTGNLIPNCRNRLAKISCSNEESDNILVGLGKGSAIMMVQSIVVCIVSLLSLICMLLRLVCMYLSMVSKKNEISLEQFSIKILTN